MSEKDLEREIRTEVDKAIENYGKAKKEIPQLGWGGILGQKDFYRGMRDAFMSPIDVGRGSLDMIKSAFKPTKVRKLPTDSQDGHERFLFAKEYYGLEDNDIKERIKASCLIFYMALIAGIVDLLIYFYISWTSGNLVTFAIFPTFSLFMWLAVQCFKYGLINYQMRKESLCPAKEYLKDNEQWFPPLSGGGKLATFLIVSLPMFMFASSAYAAGSVSDTCTSFENAAMTVSVEKVLSIPCEKDLWLQSLARIFPNVGPLADVQTGVTQTYGVGFVAALAAFVAILNAVAVGSLSYQSCIAVVNTAVDGDTMGQKWHKVWAPVRICYGFGMLAPITKGGVCMAQVFVLYIALWSGNWANLVYTSYLYGIANPTKVDSSYIPPNTVETLTDLVNLNICWVTEELNEIKNNDPTAEMWEQFSPNYTEDSHRTLILDGKKATKNLNGVLTLSGLSTLYDYEKYRWDFMNCGYMEAKKQNDRMDTVSNFTGMSTNHSLMGGIASAVNPLTGLGVINNIVQHAFAPEDNEKAFFRSRAEAINTLNGSIHNTIQDIIVSMNSAHDQQDLVAFKDPFNDKLKAATAPGGSIDTAFKQYNDAIVTAGNTLMNNNGTEEVFNAFRTSVTDNGWMLAGAYYMTTSRMTDQIRSTISGEPTTSMGSGEDTGLHSDNDAFLGSEGKHYLSRLRQSFAELYGNISPIDRSVVATGARNSSLTGHAKGYSAGGIWTEYRKGGFKAAWSYACNGLQYIIVGQIEEWAAVTPGSGSAFQQMIDFGHDLLDFAWIVALIALLMSQFGPLVKLFSWGSKIAGWGGAAGSALMGNAAGVAEQLGQSGLASFVEKNVSSVITGILVLAGLLTGLGATYAYIFPMLPYINFLFFEQGSLVLVAECMIAAPILAYLHVRGEGEQLVDQVQKTGYLILFNLFLRIPLGIFGLILSVALFETSIWINSILFKVAMNASIASNASGPVGTFAFLFLLFYIEWSLALKCFSLISTLPEKIARWFGAATESHGEAQGMREMLAFGVAQISNRATGLASKQIGKMASGGGAAAKATSNGTTGGGNGKTGGGSVPGVKK